MRSARTLLLVLCLALGVFGSARAADAPAAGLTASETQQLLDVLQNPQKRAQLISTLQSLRKVVPASGVVVPVQVVTAPTATPAAAPAKKTVALKKDSLASDLLDSAGGVYDQIDTSLSATAVSIIDYQEFVVWADQVSRDPGMLQTVLHAIWRLAIILVASLLAEYAAWRVTRRLYDRMGRERVQGETEAEAEATTPPARVTSKRIGPRARIGLKPLHSGWLLLKRLPFILFALLLDAFPTAVFLAVATLILATPLAQGNNTRLAIIAIINAYVGCRLFLSVARAVICSPSARLRLVHVSNDAAGFLSVWIRRLALVVVFGSAITQIGALCGMNQAMQLTITRLLGLIVHGMLIVMVLKRRTQVAAWLSGSTPGAWHDLKVRAASTWHIQAIILIVLVWIVYATQVQNGLGRPLHVILMTMGLLILFRIVSVIILGALDRIFALGVSQTDGRYALIGTRAARYHGPLRVLVNIVMSVGFFLVLFQFWGVDAVTWFAVGALGGRLVSSFATILVTLVIAVIVWETINFVMQVYMDELSQQGAHVRVARLRTVVPLLRNALMIALLVVIALTALSEIGINIAPLLAGASILGVAIGFGSQKLVQDFITGIFLLLENAMQVGDWVTAAGLSGTVENLSIRTLRLRAGDGSVHLIPFSAVSTVTNTNRGIGNASVSVSISYDEDTDRVGKLLSQIALDMRGEADFRDGMLSDLQYWGVDKIDGTTATLAGQIVCTDGARWGVQREYNRRVKLVFQENGIRMMPSATIMSFQHPLDVRIDTVQPETIEPPEATPAPTASKIDQPPPSDHS
ncbi:mechanosensitive ion channel domain-containing protein [Acidisoma cladoniae]|jgi:small-conductance mechanosensitive channel|uniref:mechanosensitive ion channel domain-containing protein n=1 Tax=Acidisoma cladoniae TaxID=3040935 RepID=UPI002550C47F|nr:mechanosensitive ion channel domain-containing protein [Acidisoma sp. PAMC 29798]